MGRKKKGKEEDEDVVTISREELERMRHNMESLERDNRKLQQKANVAEETTKAFQMKIQVDELAESTSELSLRPLPDAESEGEDSPFVNFDNRPLLAVWNEVDHRWPAPDEFFLQQQSTACRPTRCWRLVRVFVSATPADFNTERAFLQSDVFPQLRTWCQHTARRLRCLPVDLNWGVGGKAGAAEPTLQMGLNEIDRCANVNARPFILGMVSERYGDPIPAQQLSERLIRRFSCVKGGMSAVALELIFGAYGTINPNALICMRNPAFLETLPTNRMRTSTFATDGWEKHLEKLKQKLQERLGPKGQVDDFGIEHQTEGMLASLKQQVFEYFVTGDGIDKTTGLCKFRGLDAVEGTADVDSGSGDSGNFGPRVLRFFKFRIAKQYPTVGEVEAVESARQRAYARHLAHHEKQAETGSLSLAEAEDGRLMCEEFADATEKMAAVVVAARAAVSAHGGSGNLAGGTELAAARYDKLGLGLNFGIKNEGEDSKDDVSSQEVEEHLPTEAEEEQAALLLRRSAAESAEGYANPEHLSMLDHIHKYVQPHEEQQADIEGDQSVVEKWKAEKEIVEEANKEKQNSRMRDVINAARSAAGHRVPPMLIHGGPGSGKTTMLSQLARFPSEMHGKVFYHFVSRRYRADSLHCLLLRMLHALMPGYVQPEGKGAGYVPEEDDEDEEEEEEDIFTPEGGYTEADVAAAVMLQKKWDEKRQQKLKEKEEAEEMERRRKMREVRKEGGIGIGDDGRTGWRRRKGQSAMALMRRHAVYDEVPGFGVEDYCFDEDEDEDEDEADCFGYSMALINPPVVARVATNEDDAESGEVSDALERRQVLQHQLKLKQQEQQRSVSKLLQHEGLVPPIPLAGPRGPRLAAFSPTSGGDERTSSSRGSAMVEWVGSLLPVLHAALAQAALRGRVLIVIDAIDELEPDLFGGSGRKCAVSDDELRMAFAWVPLLLPANVRMVLSCSTGSPVYELLGRVRNSPPIRLINLHAAPSKNGAAESLQRELLKRRKIAVRHLLSARHHRQLPQAQLHELAELSGASNPLWLTLVVDELGQYAGQGYGPQHHGSCEKRKRQLQSRNPKMNAEAAAELTVGMQRHIRSLPSSVGELIWSLLAWGSGEEEAAKERARERAAVRAKLRTKKIQKAGLDIGQNPEAIGLVNLDQPEAESSEDEHDPRVTAHHRHHQCCSHHASKKERAEAKAKKRAERTKRLAARLQAQAQGADGPEKEKPVVVAEEEEEEDAEGESSTTRCIGSQFVAALCLIETSRHGLLEEELMALLVPHNFLKSEPMPHQLSHEEAGAMEDKSLEQQASAQAQARARVKDARATAVGNVAKPIRSPTKIKKVMKKKTRSVWKRTATVLYDFRGDTANRELSVTAKEKLQILGDSHEGGWVLCKSEKGEAGFVPSTYIQAGEQEEVLEELEEEVEVEEEKEYDSEPDEPSAAVEAMAEEDYFAEAEDLLGDDGSEVSGSKSATATGRGPKRRAAKAGELSAGTYDFSAGATIACADWYRVHRLLALLVGDDVSRCDDTQMATPAGGGHLRIAHAVVARIVRLAFLSEQGGQHGDVGGQHPTRSASATATALTVAGGDGGEGRAKGGLGHGVEKEWMLHWWHNRLACYFETRPMPAVEGSASAEGARSVSQSLPVEWVRRAVELPEHLLAIGDAERLGKCLLDWRLASILTAPQKRHVPAKEAALNGVTAAQAAVEVESVEDWGWLLHCQPSADAGGKQRSPSKSRWEWLVCASWRRLGDAHVGGEELSGGLTTSHGLALLLRYWGGIGTMRSGMADGGWSARGETIGFTAAAAAYQHQMKQSDEMYKQVSSGELHMHPSQRIACTRYLIRPLTPFCRVCWMPKLSVAAAGWSVRSCGRVRSTIKLRSICCGCYRCCGNSKH
jgi:hypothetical protein